MSNVSQVSASGERKDRRRLHLREVAMDQPNEQTQVAETVPPSETLGATLRAKRVERGEDAATTAGTLKMRLDQLEAIENNEFARLPGRTYAIGFVRAYAQYLGLDAEAAIQRFKDESAAAGDAPKPVELVFPEAIPEQKVPNASILIVALVIAMVIYGVSYLTMPNRKTTTAKAEPTAPSVVVVKPGSPLSQIAAPPAASPAPTSMEETSTPATDAVVLPPPSFVAGSASLPPAESPRNPFETKPVEHDASLVVAQSQTPSAAPATAPGAPRITLKALQPTYIRVRDLRQPGAKGVLFDRVLNPGESFQPPDRAGLVMQTGNAGGLQVEVDGRSIGVLGKSGEVITRIPVDPSYFLERLAATQ